VTPWQYIKRSAPRAFVAASLMSGLVAVAQQPAGAQTPPTFTIIKDTRPNQPQDFTFTATGPGIPGPIGDGIIQLDDDGSEVNDLPSTVTVPLTPNPEGSGLDPYVITEAHVEGFELTEINCFLNGVPLDPADFQVLDPQGNLIGVTGRLDVDDSAVCVFINEGGPSARVTVIKDTRPNQPQDFGFNASGPFVPEGTSFELDDDGDEGNDLPSRQSFVVAPNPEGSGLDPYVITEELVEGFELTDIACTLNGAPVALADIQVLGDGGELVGVAGRFEDGDVAVCVFINEGGPSATFTVIKDTRPEQAQDFVFNASGPFVPEGLQFPLDDDGADANPLSNSQTFVLAPNPEDSGLEPYVITEELVDGFVLDEIRCTINGVRQDLDDIQVLDENDNLIGVSGRLADGDEAVCRFINLAEVPDDDGDNDYNDYPGDSDFDFDTPFDNASDNAGSDNPAPAVQVAGTSEPAVQPAGGDPAAAVLSDAAPAPAPEAAPVAADSLPRTGSASRQLTMVAGLLLITGGVASLIGRRRKATSA
jgi:LPXTG-motif cell wall-anchored protein